MYLRTFSLLSCTLLITACGKPDNGVLAEAERRGADQAGDLGMIECAINGESSFSRVCEKERLVGEGVTSLIIRHPDGGFRRFNILTDGRGLEAADGAEPARVTVVENDRILVRVGPDKYLMPAKMKSSENAATPDASPQAGN